MSVLKMGNPLNGTGKWVDASLSEEGIVKVYVLNCSALCNSNISKIDMNC
jgi:hypothetical protein